MLLDKTFCAKNCVQYLLFITLWCFCNPNSELSLLFSLLILPPTWLLFIITVVARLYIIFNVLSIHENDTLCSVFEFMHKQRRKLISRKIMNWKSLRIYEFVERFDCLMMILFDKCWLVFKHARLQLQNWSILVREGISLFLRNFKSSLYVF